LTQQLVCRRGPRLDRQRLLQFLRRLGSLAALEQVGSPGEVDPGVLGGQEQE
jgi:hypothetical protein